MAAIYTSDIEEVKIEKMWNLLQLQEEAEEKIYLPFLKDQGDIVDHLNTLSRKIKETLKAKALIYFENTPTETSKGHATGTKCQPDFVAMLKSPTIAVANGPISSSKTSQLAETGSVSKPHAEGSQYQWTRLETTGVIRSKGKSKEASLMQAISSSTYLLQARPDLTSVLGIWTDGDDFSLILCNANRAYHTQSLKLTHKKSSLLLCAWVERLYQPFKDMSIERVVNSSVIFDVTSSHQKYLGCHIHLVGHPFGRRTIVFSEPGSSVFIKDQFISTGRRFKEGRILKDIHTPADFPGVVRIKEYGEPDLDEAALEGKVKTRLVMSDGGSPFMEIKTPQEVLMIAYDLLEVTRSLYRLRGTLHRDISHNNVLFRNDPVSFSDHKDFEDIHFVDYLLGELGPNSKAGRLQTKLLLIDFDMAQSPVTEHDGSPQSRTGTPIFMARAVRSGHRAKGTYSFFPIPSLTNGKELYQKHLQKRLDKFNNPMEKEEYRNSKEPLKLDPFIHKLRYDAESVFWLLIYWAMQAQPDDKKYPEEGINSTYWRDLTSEQADTVTVDCRSTLLEVPEDIFHTSYAQLRPLFTQMAECLKGEGFFEEFDCKKEDEYLHEALQRLIFDFLVTNIDEPFLTLKKSSNPRKPKKTPNRQQLTKDQVKSRRSRPESSQSELLSQSGSKNSSKRKFKSQDSSRSSKRQKTR